MINIVPRYFSKKKKKMFLYTVHDTEDVFRSLPHRFFANSHAAVRVY